MRSIVRGLSRGHRACARSCLAGLLLGAGLAGSVAADDGAFTYQGALTEEGTPVDGTLDMSFGLWDAAAGGVRVAPVVDLVGVPVNDGRFAVDLDFGSAALGSVDAARWLEVVVAGVTLEPRQRIRATPYSVSTRGIAITESGHAGIGTTIPEGPLHVADGTAGDVTAHPRSIAVFESGYHGYLSLLTPDATERGFLFGDPESFVNGGIIYDSPGNTDGLQFRTGGNHTRLTIDAQGDATLLGRLGVNTAVTSAQMAVVASGSAPSALAATSDAGGPTVVARNDGVGPALQLVGTGEVSAEGDGMLVVGNLAAANIALDRNEITRRDGRAGGTLFLNADGGSVNFGPNNVHLPLAYGSVFQDGALLSSSGNVIVWRASRGSYRIAVNEWVQAGDVVQVTPRPLDVHNWGFLNATAVPVPNDGLITVTISEVEERTVDCTFSFVIHRP